MGSEDDSVKRLITSLRATNDGVHGGRPGQGLPDGRRSLKYAGHLSQHYSFSSTTPLRFSFYDGVGEERAGLTRLNDGIDGEGARDALRDDGVNDEGA